MSLVLIGRIGRVHGVRGEVVLDRVSLTASELESIPSFVWIGRGGEQRPLELASVRPADTRLIVRFGGIDDREQALALSNGELHAERDQVPDAGPGQAYTFQLLGLRVVDLTGRELGVLKEVMHTGAHPIYVVQGDRELMIPAAAHVVKAVDFEAGVITVELPAGLEEI